MWLRSAELCRKQCRDTSLGRMYEVPGYFVVVAYAIYIVYDRVP